LNLRLAVEQAKFRAPAGLLVFDAVLQDGSVGAEALNVDCTEQVTAGRMVSSGRAGSIPE